MTPKGTFAALPVRAQAYIIQLYEDTCKGVCDKPKYWHTANMLNYHHGLNTVSDLSDESYWFSLKRRNPTVDELLETVFSAGEPLTILQVRYRNDGVNPEVFSETIKYFLAAQHPLSMRMFTVACFTRLLEWPEALAGLVRPCPKCSDYRLSKDSGQERRFDSRPTAYEAFHFHNKATGQCLTVGAPMAIPTNDGGSTNPPRQSIRRLRFWTEASLPCAFDKKPSTIRSPMLTAIVLDACGCMTRSELETGMLVCRRWKSVVGQHVKSLPLRHIVKAVYLDYGSVPTLEVRSKSEVVKGMDPVIRATISDAEGVSADASLLLRNSYVERLQTGRQGPETQSNVLKVLRKTVYSGELCVGEFASYDDHVRCDAVNTVAWLVPMTRLQKVTLNITLASFARNYARIFDAAAKTTVKYLYMDIFRVFDDKSQLDEAQLQPAAILAIKDRWLDFVFNSGCDHAIMLVRHSLPGELRCPFSPNDVVRRFLDMASVDHFTTCVVDGSRGGPPEACTAPVAKRQSFADNGGFLSRLNRSVGAELYDVYYVHNERADATLSVLVGNQSWKNRVILMKGALECGEESPYPARHYGEDYDDYEEEEDSDDNEKEDNEVEDEGEEKEDVGTEGEEEDDDSDKTE